MMAARTMSWNRIRHSSRRSRIVAVVVVVIIGLTGRLFVWPDTNAPGHADAIVVLGGVGPRVPEGEKLVLEGYAPLIVFSLYPGEPCIPGNKKIQVRCFH